MSKECLFGILLLRYLLKHKMRIFPKIAHLENSSWTLSCSHEFPKYAFRHQDLCFRSRKFNFLGVYRTILKTLDNATKKNS